MPPSAVSDMYSEWTSLVQKIENDRRNNVSVLATFPEGVGKDVSASVVKSLVQSPSSHTVLPSTLNSDEQVKWTMEVVGFGLTLSFTEYEIIRDCVTVECDWLTALTAPKGNVPTPVVEDPNYYARQIFLHLYYLFVPRSAPPPSRPQSGGGGGAASRQSTTALASGQQPSSQNQQDLIKHQAVLCHRVLRTVQTIAVESNLIDAQTWESILCFLLAANDALLSPPTVKEDIGDQLGERIVSVLFDVWLLSCGKSFPSPSLWKTLKELCCHWRHHACVIDQWNKTTSRLTSGVLNILYGPEFPEFKRVDEAEDRLLMSAMNHETLVQTWFRFLHVLTNPADLSKPEEIADTPKFLHFAVKDHKDHKQHPCLQKLPLIFYNAIRSIANIADAFLGIYDQAVDQMHRDYILHSCGNPSIAVASVASGTASVHQSMADLSLKSGAGGSFLAPAPTTPPHQRKTSSKVPAPASVAARKADRISKTVLTATTSGAAASSTVGTASTARPTSVSSLHASHLQSQQSSGSAGSPADSAASIPTSTIAFPHLSTINGGSVNYFPIRATCDSIFHLLGSWLFEAALVGCHLHPAHENLKNSATRRTPSFMDQHAGGAGSGGGGGTNKVMEVFDQELSSASTTTTTSGHEASPPLPKSIFGSGYEAGRAEAVAAICRILCSHKTKEEILPTYLARSYLVLYYGLQLEQDPSGQVLSSLLTNGVDLLRLNLDGIFILIPHFLTALELILPESAPRFKGHELISYVELRRSAIHLLLSMLCLPLHFRDLPLNDITATAFLSADSDFHSVSSFLVGGGVKDGSSSSGGCGVSTSDASMADSTFSALRLKLVNLLIQALHTETDSINIHMLLGGLLIIVQDSAIFESVPSISSVSHSRTSSVPPNDGYAPTSNSNLPNNTINNNLLTHNPFEFPTDPPSTHSSVSINIPEHTSSSSTSRQTSSSVDQFDADFLNPSGGRPSVSRQTRGSTFSGSSPFPGGERQFSRMSTSQQRSVFETQFSDPSGGDSATDFFGCAVKVIQAKLNKSWKTDLGMSLSALEVLCGLSKVSLTLSPPRDHDDADADYDDEEVADELTILFKTVVKFVCTYIEEQCSRPPQYHSRDLHSMIVAAYQCLSTWIVDHPRILEDGDVLQTLLETIELGISGAKSRNPNNEKDAGILKADKPLRPASMRVREAAESVLSVVLDHAGSFPSPCGPESLSSLLDEELLLRQCGDVDVVDGCGNAREAATRHFRYFVIDNAYIVGLFEQPLANEQDILPTVTVILRGCRGKHVWTMQLRHLPRNLAMKARGSRANAVVARPHPEEPVVESKPQPRRWWPELVDTIPEVNADNSIPSLEDVLMETNGMEEHLELVKLLEEQAAFEESVAETYEQETASVRAVSPTLLDPSLECKAPPVTHEFQTARLFLSHFGFLNQSLETGGGGVTSASAANNAKVIALDSKSATFLNDMEHLDALPSRTVDTAFVFYVKAGQRTAEEILSNADHSESIHPHFFQLINSLGWPVNVAKHAGWTGNVLSSWKVMQENPFLHDLALLPNPKAHLYDGVENVLYYGDINTEVAFLTPSLHSCDVLRASLSRRASECAAGSFHGVDPLIKTTSTETSISTASSSSSAKHSAEIPIVFESPRGSLTETGSVGDTLAGGVGKNALAGNVHQAANKKTKFFAGKPERHKSEATFDANVAKSVNRPSHSVIGDGFEGRTGAGAASNNSNNSTATKRPLSLELEQKTTETIPSVNNQTTTTTTTASNARGYREIISPSVHPGTTTTTSTAASSSTSGIAETPRSRRVGKREIASLAAPDLKVMIVWLQSYEDRPHFPALELMQNHCLTGAEPYAGRSSMNQSNCEMDVGGVSSSSSSDSNMFIIFVHPLQNGLFRINLQSPSSKSALAIPVVGGMVLSRRLLGVTIRQTVINVCQRKRLDDADVNQPPHVKRRYKIQEITSKYHEQMADPEFLTALFREVPQK